MDAEPKIAGAPAAQSMSPSEAMDVLEEFGITEADYERVMAAMEVIYSGKPEPEPPGETEADDMSEQQAMADEIFASGRNRMEMR